MVKCDYCKEDYNSLRPNLKPCVCLDCWLKLPSDHADQIWKETKKELGL